MTRQANLFLIGSPKTGSTSLAAELAQHPDIYCSPLKEPRFYDARVYYDFPEDYPISREEYLVLYSSAPKSAKWLLDASVFIMYSEEAVRQILYDCPEARFIVMLRDPLTASKSMHVQRFKTFNEHMREVDEDFYHCFDSLEQRKKGEGFPKGCRNHMLFRYDLLFSYEKWIPQLITLLGPKLLVLRYEDYCSDPKKIHQNIFEFVDVSSDFVVEPQRLNPSLVVEESKLARVVYGSAHRLRRFRPVLAPIWRLVRPLLERMNRRKPMKQEVSPEGDQRVRQAFSATYDYLEKLNAR